MTRIVPLKSVISNQYLLIEEHSLLLIDTGITRNYTNIYNVLGKYKYSTKSNIFIIITHADADHYGCLSKVQHNIENIISAAAEPEAKAIISGISSRELKPKGVQRFIYHLIGRLFMSTKSARIDRLLAFGEEFPFLGGLEVLDTKGHTPGHISLWSKTTRTLFSGDSIIIQGKSLAPSKGPNTWNKDLAIESFEKQISLKPDRIYGGHGIWSRD